MEAVVDTNVYVAAIVEDDVNHRKAREALKKLEKWLTPTIVVHELAWFFRREALEDARRIISDLIYNVRFKLIKNSLDDVLYALTGLKNYNDRLIMHAALRLKAPLVTFDEELAKEAEKAGVPVLETS